MPTPAQQLLSQTIYVTDGITSDWNFSFSNGYLDPSHVKAYYLDSAGVRTNITAFSLSGTYQLHTASVLPVGLTLVIYRDTPKTAPIVDFTDGSGLTELALDTNARQAVMLAAEASDANVYTTTVSAVEAANTAVASSVSATAAAISAAASAASAAASASNSSGVGGGASGDHGFFQNESTINHSFTINAGYNAGSFGPVTLASGVVVTVPVGSTWTIV